MSLNKESEEIRSIVASIRACAVDERATYFRYRQRQIYGLYNLVKENYQTLISSIAKDTGRPEPEAEIEVLLVARHLHELFKEVDFKRLTSQHKSDFKNGRIKKPYGAVVIVGHAQAPLDSIISPLSAAIAAGNTAVCLAAPESQATGAFLKGLFMAYLDRRAYALVFSSETLVQALLASAQTFGVATATSDSLRSAIVQSPAKTLLTPDLTSSTSPAGSIAIVSKTSPISTLAKVGKLIARGRFFAAGQAPGSVSIAYVHEERHAELVQHIIDATNAMYGSSANRSKDFGRLAGSTVKDVEKLLSIPIKDSAKIVFGAQVDVANDFISPTIIEDVTTSSYLCSSISAPILPVVPFTSVEDVMSHLEDKSHYATYLFCNAIEADHLSNEISSQIFIINDVPLETLVGVLQPSLAPTRALRWLPDTFSKHVAIIPSPSSASRALQNVIAPYTRTGLGLARKLLNRDGLPTLNLLVPKHPPIILRAFFPQGLFFTVGVVLTVLLSSTGFGVTQLYKFYRARS